MPSAPIQVRSLTRAGDVGANAYLVTTPHCRVLLDAGAATADRLEWLDGLDADFDRPLFVWISHLHADHIGALPSLYKRHTNVHVVMTPLSAALMPAACRGLFRESHHSEHASQALAALSHRLPLHTRWRLPLGDDVPGRLFMTALPCGHVPGAASLLLEVEHEEKFHKIFYLPDFSTHGATLAEPFDPALLTALMADAARLDLLIMEGMLGSDAAANRVRIEEEMASLVSDCVAWATQRRGGQLIAAQGFGVALDVVHHLDRAMRDEEEGLELIVHDFLEPLFRAIARSPSHAERDLAQGWLSSVRFMPLAMCEEMLQAGQVVVASDEHLSPGSPSCQLVANILERQDARIFLFPGSRTRSLARRILDAPAGASLEVGKKRHLVVRAERVACQLPNHATRKVLIDAVLAMDPARVALVHGPRNGLLGLRSALEKKLAKKRRVCEVELLHEGAILLQGETP